MPISKNGKLYYTEEQKAEALMASALEYARSAGYDLIKKGKYYTLREHDSMVFSENGMWNWNSRGLYGGALAFMTMYEHKPFVESVLYLAGERGLTAEQKPIAKDQFKPKQTEQQETKPFELPENSGNLKRLFAYLCKTRHLDGDIIKSLVDEGKIYAGGKYSNAVFVSFDKDGVARGAFQRGTSTMSKTPFKMEVTSSDKSYAFHIPARKGATAVAVFEAAIDAISHASLAKMDGQDYAAVHRISIGGCTDFRAVDRFLEEHPEIQEIICCLDNDTAGKEAIKKMHNRYYDKCEITVEVPNGKDWNEDLCSRFESQQSKQQQEVKQESYDMDIPLPEAPPPEVNYASWEPEPW